MFTLIHYMLLKCVVYVFASLKVHDWVSNAIVILPHLSINTIKLKTQYNLQFTLTIAPPPADQAASPNLSIFH